MSLAALERLLPANGGAAGLPRIGRRLVVEVGFGMGEATVACAAADPTTDLLGVEVHTPGVAALLRLLEQAEVDNVRIVEGDAVAVLSELPAGSVTEVRLWFPDPWPKSRHAKRRFIQPSTAVLIASRLVPGGRLHLATDSASYVEHAQSVLTGRFDVRRIARPADRPVTRFEARARAAGRNSYDLVAVVRP